MKGKIIILLVSIALLVGMLSGCVEEANKAPVASFTFSPTDVYVNLTVTFTDTSTDEDGTIAAWLWDLGDGNTSISQIVTHNYSTIGDFIVKLTVTDDDGANDTTSQTITVSYKPPAAAFDYPENITVNTSIQFTDNSTKGDANITSWEWDFDGDGTIDNTTQNPTHTYNTTGNFTVTLKVTDDNDQSDEKSVTIEVIAAET